MTHEPEDDDATGLVEALRRLRREEPPPHALEERLVAELRREGRLATPGAGRRRWAVAALSAAAIVVAFGTGVALGRRLSTPPTAPASQPQFVLFLYQTATSLATPEDGDDRVAEYRAWARTAREAGRLVTGEKLSDRGVLLWGVGPAGRVEHRLVESQDGVLSGYFVIQAASFDEALDVARSCPHLRHGGRIALRPIDPV